MGQGDAGVGGQIIAALDAIRGIDHGMEGLCASLRRDYRERLHGIGGKKIQVIQSQELVRRNLLILKIGGRTNNHRGGSRSRVEKHEGAVKGAVGNARIALGEERERKAQRAGAYGFVP